MTRTSLRIGVSVLEQATKQAVKQAVRQAARSSATGTRVVEQAAKQVVKQVVKEARSSSAAVGAIKPPALPGSPANPRRGLKDCVTGMAFGTGGARRYYLYKPPGLALTERLPLMVMLHGCGQDADGFALSTRMNRVAARERFLVLYPEQDRLANPQRCWNWYDTRSRQAYGEASILLAAIDQVCLLYPVDRERVGLAGMSAGASMGALLATRYPERFKAVVMHSGVPPGAADSAASALGAMRGRRGPTAPTGDRAWPPLLVIQGSRDHVVAPANGAASAHLWAAAAGAKTVATRQVQRGLRYPMTVTEYKSRGRTAATLCEVQGLGHAWSGGDGSERFSDDRGPDASRMVWAFMLRQFKAGLKVPGVGLKVPGVGLKVPGVGLRMPGAGLRKLG